MTLNGMVNSVRYNQKISKDDLLEYIHLYKWGNSPVRVFMMDGGTSLSGRDGFVFMEGDYFKVRWHFGRNEDYTLKQNDVIGIVERNKMGYEPKRLVLNSKK